MQRVEQSLCMRLGGPRGATESDGVDAPSSTYVDFQALEIYLIPLCAVRRLHCQTVNITRTRFNYALFSRSSTEISVINPPGLPCEVMGRPAPTPDAFYKASVPPCN